MIGESLTAFVFFLLGFAERAMMGVTNGLEKANTAKMASDNPAANETMALSFCGTDFKLYSGCGDGGDNHLHREPANPRGLGCFSRTDGQERSEKEGTKKEIVRCQNQKIRRKPLRNRAFRLSREGGEYLIIAARTPNEARLILMRVLKISADEAALYQVKEQPGPLTDRG